MIGLLRLFLALVSAQFKSKSRLEAENAALRHQLMVLRRKVPGRVRLTMVHRGRVSIEAAMSVMGRTRQAERSVFAVMSAVPPKATIGW